MGPISLVKIQVGAPKPGPGMSIKYDMVIQRIDNTCLPSIVPAGLQGTIGSGLDSGFSAFPGPCTARRDGESPVYS